MRYSVVYYSKDIVECKYITHNYLEAVGFVECDLWDRIHELQLDGIKVIKEDRFYNLNCDTGFGWSIVTEKETETWYLLRKADKENETTR